MGRYLPGCDGTNRIDEHRHVYTRRRVSVLEVLDRAAVEKREERSEAPKEDVEQFVLDLGARQIGPFFEEALRSRGRLTREGGNLTPVLIVREGERC